MIRIHSNAQRRDRVGDSDTLECGRERSSGRFEFAQTEMDEIVPDKGNSKIWISKFGSSKIILEQNLLSTLFDFFSPRSTTHCLKSH